MLDFIRRSASSWFIKVVFGAIVIVFVFWGVGNFKSSRREVAATVNGDTVHIEDYKVAYNSIIQRYRQMFQGNIPSEILDKLDIKKQALDNLINLSLIKQETKKMGILVSDKEVQEEIMKVPDFNLNNNFNKNIYLKMLSNLGITPVQFEEEMRTQILIEKSRRILGAGINVTDLEIKDSYNFNNEEINVFYAILDLKNPDNDTFNATEEQVVKFYEDNKEKYKTSPSIKIKYINFSKKDFEKEVNLSENDLENYYKDNLSKYKINEQRKASHILLKVDQNSTEETIKSKYGTSLDLLKRIREGESFEAISKEYSDDTISAQRGGDLGFIEKGKLVKPFEDMLFSMAEGNVSQPVLSDFGWHIIKLEKIQPEHYKKFEEVKDEIQERVKQNRLDFIMHNKVNSAYDEIVLSGSFDEYCGKNNIKINETDFLDEKALLSLNLTKDSISSIFQLNKGSLSSVLKLADGFIIVELIDLKPPYIPEFNDVKNNVEKDFQSKMQKENVRKKANDILNLAKKSNLSSAISQSGLKQVVMKETGFIKRKDIGTLSGIPSEIVMDAFKLSKEKPYPDEVFESGNKFYIISLKDKKVSDKEMSPDEKNQIKEKFYQTRLSDVFSRWVEQLRKKADIKITEGLL